MIVGVDGRSQSARRYRDLVDAILAEFGRTADPVAVRELAGLRLSCEVTQVAVINGADHHAANQSGAPDQPRQPRQPRPSRHGRGEAHGRPLCPLRAFTTAWPPATVRRATTYRRAGRTSRGHEGRVHGSQAASATSATSATVWILDHPDQVTRQSGRGDLGRGFMPMEDWIQRSETARFLYDWQTLVTGVLAVAAAVGTIWATIKSANREVAASKEQTAVAQRQIETTLRLDRQRIARERYAFYAMFNATIGRVIADVIKAREVCSRTQQREGCLSSLTRPARAFPRVLSLNCEPPALGMAAS